jgi:hypothetical protein
MYYLVHLFFFGSFLVICRPYSLVTVITTATKAQDLFRGTDRIATHLLLCIERKTRTTEDLKMYFLPKKLIGLSCVCPALSML